MSPTDIAAEAPSYLFLSSIAHIRELKRGPFHEHSPLLHQIATTVPTWYKVTKGLWDMYKVEVLSKVPVVQHCRFGDVGMRWTDSTTGEGLPSSGDGRADDEDERDGETAGAALDTFVVTPAPWTRGGTESASATSMGEVRPLPPPERFGGSTTVSVQYSSSTAHTRRQHPTTFPLAPPTPAVGVSSPLGSRPVSFVPPTLFPPRGGAGPTTQVRSSATSARRTTNTATTTTTGPPATGSTEMTADGTGTLAAQGGAAASSSPFGVLPPARLGSASGPAAWNAEADPERIRE